LALLFGEPGGQLVAEAIAADAVMSAINLAEVATVLVRNGKDAYHLLTSVTAQVAIEDFSQQDCFAVAAMYPLVSAKGLSLGDRACLALAQRLDLPALTAERAWLGLPHGVTVRLIRMAP
jgi:ribonuclease VapC